MSGELAPELVRWVQEGGVLFARALQTLHQVEESDTKARILAAENDRLQENVRTLQAEVDALKAERAEIAETLKVFAEHVTKIAIIAIERLGSRPRQ
jgi:uncharacterized protein YlxW (UPF0749 family)